MSNWHKEGWLIRPGTIEDAKEVFSAPDELGIWADADTDWAIHRSLYVLCLEKHGELFGAWGVIPFSLASPACWVWFRIQNPRTAIRVIPKPAKQYFDGLLEERFTDIYATIRTDGSERFVKHFGFERDKSFEMRYGKKDLKIYRKRRNGV